MIIGCTVWTCDVSYVMFNFTVINEESQDDSTTTTTTTTDFGGDEKDSFPQINFKLKSVGMHHTLEMETLRYIIFYIMKCYIIISMLSNSKKHQKSMD